MKTFYPQLLAALKGKPLKRTALAAVMLVALLLAAMLPVKLFAQAPAISYSSPQTYITSTAITALTPTSVGGAVAAYGYSTGSPLTIASGFGQPLAVAVDAAGNVYVADQDSTVITKIPAGGSPQVSLGSGLSQPHGVAVDGAGNVYVADTNNGEIKEILAAGGTIKVIGSGFSQPTGIAVDGAGNVYVADSNGVKEILATTGATITFTLASGFSGSYTVAVDAAGNIYFTGLISTGSAGPVYHIYEIPAGGGAMLSIASGLTAPSGVAVDAAGNVYFSTGLATTIRVFAPGGSQFTIGSGFYSPRGVAVDGAGNVYVADTNNGAIKEIKPVGGYFISPFLPVGLSFSTNTGIISGTPTVVSPATNYTVKAYNSGGSGTATVNIGVNAFALSYSSPQTYTVGAAITALAPTSSGMVAAYGYNSSPLTITGGFGDPTGVATDAAGNVYVADQISTAIIKLPAGGGSQVALGSGFNKPAGVAVDRAGNVYVADSGNGEVKEIPVAAGGTIKVIGSGFYQPYGVAVDAAGNVYVADGTINAIKEILASTGATVTLASGFTGVNGVAVDAAGNIYFTSNAVTGPTNNQTTTYNLYEIPAGGGAMISIGSGVSEPTGVAADAAGNVYLTEGTATTATVFAAPTGAGGSQFTIASGFKSPLGVAVDGAGNVYVADSGNGAIKEITPNGGYFISPFLPAGLSFSTNTGIISGTPTIVSPAANYTVTAYNGGGSGTATVNITVNPPPPPAIGYSSPQTYIAGTAITALAPVSTGGAVASPAYSGSTITIGTNISLPAAGFIAPISVAADAAGDVYAGDEADQDVRKYPAGGGSLVNIGSGVTVPAGVAVDAAGNVYVCDEGNSAVKEFPVGGGGPVILGSGFIAPRGVAVDGAGNVYVADAGLTVIIRILAGNGGTATLGSGFLNPYGVAVDAAGNVYVADSGHNLVAEIPAGTNTPVTLASGFNAPAGIAVDAAGNVFVADKGNNAIKEIPAGGSSPVTPIAIGGSGFNGPLGVAVDGAGNVYVADAGNSVVKEIVPVGGYYIGPFLPGGLSFNNATGLISGTPTAISAATNYTVTAYNSGGSGTAAVNIRVNAFALSYSSPQTYTAGTAVAALAPTSVGGTVAAYGYNNTPVTISGSFRTPTGVAVDAAGNVYVADLHNTVIKKIPAGGGAWVSLGTGFNQPLGVAVDGAGNVYVADTNNNEVKEIPAAGGPIKVIGTGFSEPLGVAVDGAGNVYVASYDSTVKEVFAIGGATVTLTSVNGVLGGIAADAAGNVYVGYGAGSSASVFRIPAGGGARVSIGSGFLIPQGLAVDAAGNVYVADLAGNTITVVAAGGSQFTIGSGFVTAQGVAVDAAGNVYVTDTGNSAIKEIKPLGGYFISPFLPAGLSFNSNTGIISGTPTVASPAANYTVTAYNATGIGTAALNITVSPLPPPTISYSGPQSYITGTAVAALAPVSTGGTVASPAYSSSSVALPTSINPLLGFIAPQSVATDAAGDVYAGCVTGNVREYPAGGGSLISIGSGIGSPAGVAVDCAGNVYVADEGNSEVKEFPVGGGGPVILGSGFVSPRGVAVDGAGNVYVADAGLTAIMEIPAGNGSLVTLGSGFLNPYGVAVDAAGNVYVADAGHNLIAEIPAGNGAPVTLASGFNAPAGIAVDAEGNVFVADNGNNEVKEIPAGSGTAVVIGSGPVGLGVAVDRAGNVYVADGAHNVVRQITPLGGYFIGPFLPAGLSFNNTTGVISGTPDAVGGSPAANYTVTAYNSAGNSTAAVNIRVNAFTLSYSSPQTYAAGTAITALAPTLSSGTVAAYGYNRSPVTIASGFALPQGVAVDAAGNVYVADQGSTAIKEIPAGGGSEISLGSGFSQPVGVAVDGAGNVYVADLGNSEVKEILAAGGTIKVIGSGFTHPGAVAVDGAGNVYVADSGTGAIKEILAATGATITLASGLQSMPGVAVDAAGNVYFTSQTDTGDITTLTVTYHLYKIPVGGGAMISIGSGLIEPYGVAVDAAGNVYMNGLIATTVTVFAAPAGAGGSQFTIGSGFNAPQGVAVDAAGNVYVADSGTGSVKEIKPVGGYFIGPFLPAGLSFNNTTGIISGTPTAASPATNYTVTAYNGGSSGTGAVNIKVNPFAISYSSPQTYTAGTAIAALAPTSVGGAVAAYGYSSSQLTIASGFGSLAGVAADALGNVYIVNVDSTVITKQPAGGGRPVAIGSGFKQPNSVAVDAAGNVYVSDSGNGAIKEILAAGGTVKTIGSGFSGPAGVAVDGAGNVYVVNGTNVVSEILAGGATVTLRSGFISLNGVAVDAAGNIYVIDIDNGAVNGGTLYMIPANRSATVSIASGISQPYGIAVDAAGNVYLADGGSTAITVIPAGGSQFTIGSGPDVPSGVAVDAAGNVYVANPNHGEVNEIKPVGGYFIGPFLPGGLNFSTNTGIISGKPTVVSPATNYTVTAYNSAGSGTAAVNIAVIKPSSNAALSYLQLSSGTLSPVFNYLTKSYTATVSNATSTITATPRAADATEAITVNGVTVASEAASKPINLAVGQNTITTILTAQNGVTTDTYTITVTRLPALSALTARSGTLTPAFASATTGYSATVINTTSTITITPATSDANSTVTVDGTTVTSGTASSALPLNVGQNTITIIVTSQDGTATQTYTVTVTRLKSSNDYLSYLQLSNGTLSPAFNYLTQSYTARVSNTTGTITVTPRAADATEAITVNGVTVASEAASGPINLAVGQNTITTIVTAQNVAATKTYTTTVTRLPALSALTVSSGTVIPPFASGITRYSAYVINPTNTIAVTPTTSDAHSTIKVNSTAVTSGTASSAFPLSVGQNTITIVVTSQDGTATQTYTLTVTRYISSNAALSYLQLSSGTLSPAFNYLTQSYTASVSNATGMITVTPRAADATQVITVDGVTVASETASGPINLTVGSNTITTIVTAQNVAATKTYTVTVTRAAPGDNSVYEPVSVVKPDQEVTLEDDGIMVHQAVSPNGDGINDFLTIDNIANYPDNHLVIMNRNGMLVYEAKGYDNSARIFDGHSNKTGQMQLPGTYFYSLDYTVKGIAKHKTGFIVLKY